MTGEITSCRGLVLPVGGIKEKVLAAKRGRGIGTIILPKKNEKDLKSFPHLKKGLKFHYL